MLHFVSEDQINTILEHAKEDYPNECCGIIAGRDGCVEGVIRLKNELGSPVEYAMNGKELKAALDKLDLKGLDFLGTYHSHPTSEAYPSMTDVAKAGLRELDHLIISLKEQESPTIKNFKIDNGSITLEPFIVAA